MEPDPEPEPEPEPRIKLHQFTEEWQGVRVHGLFAMFTGSQHTIGRPATCAVPGARRQPCRSSRVAAQARCLCGLEMIRGRCQTYPHPAATNMCALTRQPYRHMASLQDRKLNKSPAGVPAVTDASSEHTDDSCCRTVFGSK